MILLLSLKGLILFKVREFVNIKMLKSIYYVLFDYGLKLKHSLGPK